MGRNQSSGICKHLQNKDEHLQNTMSTHETAEKIHNLDHFAITKSIHRKKYSMHSFGNNTIFWKRRLFTRFHYLLSFISFYDFRRVCILLNIFYQFEQKQDVAHIQYIFFPDVDTNTPMYTLRDTIWIQGQIFTIVYLLIIYIDWKS